MAKQRPNKANADPNTQPRPIDVVAVENGERSHRAVVVKGPIYERASILLNNGYEIQIVMPLRTFGRGPNVGVVGPNRRFIIRSVFNDRNDFMMALEGAIVGAHHMVLPAIQKSWENSPIELEKPRSGYQTARPWTP